MRETETQKNFRNEMNNHNNHNEDKKHKKGPMLKINPFAILILAILVISIFSVIKSKDSLANRKPTVNNLSIEQLKNTNPEVYDGDAQYSSNSHIKSISKILDYEDAYSELIENRSVDKVKLLIDGLEKEKITKPCEPLRALMLEKLSVSYNYIIAVENNTSNPKDYQLLIDYLDNYKVECQETIYEVCDKAKIEVEYIQYKDSDRGWYHFKEKRLFNW